MKNIFQDKLIFSPLKKTASYKDKIFSPLGEKFFPNWREKFTLKEIFHLQVWHFSFCK